MTCSVTSSGQYENLFTPFWKGVLGKGVASRKECETAWKALSLLAEGLDLETHICYTVDNFHSVQETLDIYSVQDNILGFEVYRDN